MLKVGCHLSSSRGFLAMGREAVRIGADTFQFFTRNPRGGSAKPLNSDDVAAHNAFAAEHGLGPILAHAAYTMNPATVDAKLMKFVRETIADDLLRIRNIPGCMYNIHPGSHVGQGAAAGIKAIAETLDSVLARNLASPFLLETMTGKGTEVGGTFEELRRILDMVKLPEKLGVCLDTCHVFDAGYDIVGDLDGVLEKFDDVVGLDRLKAIHINDSLNPLGGRKDRHAKLGEGNIGLAAFERIVRHPVLRNLPFYLETPNDLDGYAKEIRLLKRI